MEEKSENVYQYNYNGTSYRCVGDRIVVKPLPYATKELKGIELNNDKDKTLIALEHPWRGEVIMVGDGKISGLPETNPPAIAVGDIVFFEEQRNPIEVMVNIDGTMRKYLSLREFNIILVQKKQAPIEN